MYITPNSQTYASNVVTDTLDYVESDNNYNISRERDTSNALNENNVDTFSEWISIKTYWEYRVSEDNINEEDVEKWINEVRQNDSQSNTGY